MTFRPTHQSAYWLILSLLVLALGICVIYLNLKIDTIYNQIDQTNAMMNIHHQPTAKLKHPL
ncbi:MAG: hypothetical protein ACHQTE_02425 [Candidatus Saccharimonadales bacterium]